MRTSRDERLALVGEQEHSGLTASAFCRERGIGYQNFLRWKRTLAADHSTGAAAFVELALEATAPAAPVTALIAELSLGPGIVLKVFTPFPGHR